MIRKKHYNFEIAYIVFYSFLAIFVLVVYLLSSNTSSEKYTRWRDDTLEKQVKTCDVISIKGYSNKDCDWYNVYYMQDGKKQFQKGRDILGSDYIINTRLFRDCDYNEKPYVRFLRIDKTIPIPKDISNKADNRSDYPDISKGLKYFEIHVPVNYKIEMEDCEKLDNERESRINEFIAKYKISKETLEEYNNIKRDYIN